MCCRNEKLVKLKVELAAMDEEREEQVKSIGLKYEEFKVFNRLIFYSFFRNQWKGWWKS
jgi:hypothetical protein